MAFINLCGFETGDASELNTISGTASIQSSVKRTGGYALRVNPTGTGEGYGRITAVSNSTGLTVIVGAATVYDRFYFRVDLLPVTFGASEEIARWLTNTLALKMTLRITDAGKLRAYDSTGTVVIVTGTTVLSTGVWYRIEVQVGSESATDADDAPYEVKINGVSEFSGTDKLLVGATARHDLGKGTNRNAQSVDFYYDDCYADDAAFPGAGQIEVMQPNADGTYTDWTGTYADVDEIPHDGDGTIAAGFSINQVETAALESAAAAGISGTIKCVKSVVIVRDLGGGIANQLRTRVNSTDNTSTAASLTESYQAQCRLFAVDFSDSAAWTTADLDQLEVGSKLAASVNINMTLACVMVDFEPAVAFVPVPLRGRLHRVPAFHK